MSQNLSLRSIRDALLAASRAGEADPVALENLRSEIAARVDEIRRSMDRAFEFAGKGLVSEAASVVTDFPDLAREADLLLEIATMDPQISSAWRAIAGDRVRDEHLPRREEIERLAGLEMRANELRPQLDALRLSALRSEPVHARMRILRRLRTEDPRNRMWLDQIEALETEWIRSISELRGRTATREELDEALVALETHEWVAGVPRGLREELYAKVKPLRAEEAGERYQRLVEEIHAASSRMDRPDLIRLESAWASVHQETGRMPSADLTAIVEPAFAWLTRVEAEEAAQRAFDDEVDRLETMLAERRGIPEIEAQIAVLRDAGRAAPEGLVERALRYAEIEREAARRRHRLVLAGSILGAIALVSVGAMALSMHAAQREREALLAALRGAVTERDSDRLRSLTVEIRTKFGEPGPELAAALTEADAVILARTDRTAEIRRVLAACEKELASLPPRARLDALKQALSGALADAEPAERATAQALEARRVSALESRDAAAAETTTTALAAVDRSLLAWPVPDAWSDAQLLEDARWSGYIAALGEIRRGLDGASAAADGHQASIARIQLKRDAIDSRISEAKSRTDALRAAVRDLSDDRMLSPITSEQQLIERLENAVEAHAPILARQDLLESFEKSLACADAYRGMEAWRTDVRPALTASLGPGLVERPSLEVAAGVATRIRNFLAAHPAAPMGGALARLANDIDPNGGAVLWSPQRVEAALVGERIAGIEEVPLRDGRRFYRRPPTSANAPAIQRDPTTRALKSIADLATDPERLSSILAVERTDIDGKTFANAVSLAWAQAERTLAETQSHRVVPIMLDLLGRILASTESDPLLQLRALRDAVGILIQSGHAEGELRAALESWLNRCRDSASDALVADWVAAGYDAEPINWRKSRAQARSAIEAFPDLSQLREKIDAESRLLGDALAAFVPAGVAGCRKASGSSREMRISGITEDLFVLIRRGTDWVLVPLPITDGRPGPIPADAPPGPVVIYRRNRS